ATRPWRDATTLQIERLYLAFFLREADAAGLQQWVALRWFGIPLPLIAEHFAASPEFRNRYGSLSNPAFVDLVYSNVLHRSPDFAGKSDWTARLNAGATRGQVMVEFSDSAEFVTRTRTAP